MDFRYFKDRTRQWKLECSFESYRLARQERRLHPVRVRHKRIAVQILMWFPSAIAAAVLFFLPAASHLLYPRSHYLKHYRIPIPRTVLVLPSPFGVNAYVSRGDLRRFGITHLRQDSLSSSLNFVSFDSDRGAAVIEDSGQQPLRQFQYGNVVVSCRKQVYSSSDWDIRCASPASVREYNFHAVFQGREEDAALFFKILEGVQRVD